MMRSIRARGNTMRHTEILTFVNFVVSKYLRNKPELHQFREDLQQEGYLVALQKMSEWDPDKGVELKLWLDYQVRYAITKYIDRQEVPHFKKPLDEGPEGLWDLPSPIDVEELEYDGTTEETQRELIETLSGVSLSDNELKFLRAFFEHGEITSACESLGYSRQRGSEYYLAIVRKAKESNNVPLTN